MYSVSEHFFIFHRKNHSRRGEKTRTSNHENANRLNGRRRKVRAHPSQPVRLPLRATICSAPLAIGELSPFPTHRLPGFPLGWHPGFASNSSCIFLVVWSRRRRLSPRTHFWSALAKLRLCQSPRVYLFHSLFRGHALF